MSKQVLSAPQENIWNMQKVYPDTSITNVAGAYKIKGYKFDPSVWEKAINLFIANNEGMRIRINNENPPTQYVAEFKEESFKTIDLRKYSEEQKQQMYKGWAKEKLGKKLYEIKIVRFSDAEHGIYFLKDHIMTDGWSESLFLGKLTEYYIALLEGKEIPLEENLTQYSRFLENEQEYFTGARYERDKEYWQKQFQEKPVLITPGVNPSENLTGDKYSELLGLELTNEIKAFCFETKITPVAFFEALVFAYLKIITDEKNIIIGSPVLNRVKSKKETEISGMCVNTLPFQIQIEDDMDFASLCSKISSEKFPLFKYGKIPYSDIQRDLEERFGYTGKLFDVVFSFQNGRTRVNGEPIDYGESEWIHNGFSNNSLSVHIDDRDSKGQYVIALEYQTDVFQLSEIKNILERLKSIAHQVIKNKEIAIKDINVLCEQDLIDYATFNNGTKTSITKTVIEELEENARLYPNELSLIFGKDIKLTYHELNNLVNSLGHTIKSYNFQKGTIIPVIGERSYKTIISALAIAKAGYAYTILDTDIYKNGRIDSLMKSCGAKFYLTYGNCAYSNPETIALNIHEDYMWSHNFKNLNTKINLEDIFVVLHTSGSSGEPKAVLISHEAAVNMGKNNPYLIDGCNHGISLIPMTFDAFTMDVLTPLLNGKTLVLSTPEEQQILREMHMLIKKYPKSMVILTPTRAKEVLSSCNDNDWVNIDSIILGGETFGQDLIDLINRKSGARIYNLYGPTETAVYNCGKEIIDGTVNLGTPTTNFNLYILNKYNQILPPKVIGEIVPVGPGVAHGYLGDEELTKKQFITINGQRAYKTGDYGSLNHALELVYRGRKDRQRKINGVRFEEEEIENLMNLFEGITISAALLKEYNGEPYVAAYYESAKEIDEDKLTEYLELHLNASVVPSVFIKMEKLPTTTSDKLDRAAFPDPNFEKMEANNYLAPQNETQKILCEIWQEVLKKEKVGIKSTWKALRGSSLKGLTMVDAVEKRFGIKFNSWDMEKSPSIEILEALINAKTIGKTEEAPNLLAGFDFDNIVVNRIKEKTNDAVLITGASGYLGMHILFELLETTNRKIYALVRDKDKFNALKYHYFQNGLEQYQNRFEVIEGDITKNNCGLSYAVDKLIKNEVTDVFHTAANVKHYGPLGEFKQVNVDGTYNILKKCAEMNAKMHHVSTVSVCGQGLTSQKRQNYTFTENDLDVGQGYQENTYVWTKYVSEQLVHEFQKKGLEANIYRIGQLSNRASDGLFQYNSNESGFKLLVESIRNLKALPRELECMPLQIIPVDQGAKAMVTLMNIGDNSTYHVYDCNSKALKNYLAENGIDYTQLSIEDFLKKLETLMKSDDKFTLIGQYFKDMMANASYNKISNEETNRILYGGTLNEKNQNILHKVN